MKIINTIFSVMFVVVLIMVSSLFLVPLLPLENNIQIKIVESGSMEPSILTGSLVVIRPQSSYSVGEVVTFESSSADVPTTHRIIGVREAAGQTYFMTKGDANEEADTQEAALRSVIGTVLVAVPYAGFVLDFARQPVGFLLLIVVPALLIIIGEIEKIWVQIRKTKQEKEIKTVVNAKIPNPKELIPVVTIKNVRMMDIARPVATRVVKTRPVTSAATFTPARNYVISSYVAPICIVLSSILFSAMSFTGSTVSYFNDIETAIENLLQASALDFSLSPTNLSFVLDSQSEAMIEPHISIESGDAPVTYNVRVDSASASSTLCAALVVNTTLPYIYSGALVDLEASAIVFNDDWSLAVTLDPTVLVTQGDTCTIDVVYTASRVGVPVTAGYDDMEKISLLFSTPLPAALPNTEPLMLQSDIEPQSEVPIEEGTSTSKALTPSSEEEPSGNFTEAEISNKEEITNNANKVLTKHTHHFTIHSQE